jgi:hypothetical protein
MKKLLILGIMFRSAEHCRVYYLGKKMKQFITFSQNIFLKEVK